MLKNCLTCGKEFNALQRELTRGNGKYCSRTCGYKRPVWSNRKKTVVSLVCAFCHCTFDKQACRIREGASKSGLRFCSRGCKDKAQSLDGGIKEIWPDHFGTAKEVRNYREKALKSLPNLCNRCGYKEVLEVLQVHHKDRSHENGDIENLEILCPTCHEVEHYLSKDGKWGQKEVGES